MAKPIKHRKILAEAIRFYRKRLDLTQEKLGELADLNPKYIGEVERCETIARRAAVRGPRWAFSHRLLGSPPAAGLSCYSN